MIDREVALEDELAELQYEYEDICSEPMTDDVDLEDRVQERLNEIDERIRAIKAELKEYSIKRFMRGETYGY